MSILGCTLKPVSNFSITYTVARKVQKYGDAFSKSSSIHTYNMTLIGFNVYAITYEGWSKGGGKEKVEEEKEV